MVPSITNKAEKLYLCTTLMVKTKPLIGLFSSLSSTHPCKLDGTGKEGPEGLFIATISAPNETQSIAVAGCDEDIRPKGLFVFAAASPVRTPSSPVATHQSAIAKLWPFSLYNTQKHARKQRFFSFLKVLIRLPVLFKLFDTDLC